MANDECDSYAFGNKQCTNENLWGNKVVQCMQRTDSKSEKSAYEWNINLNHHLKQCQKLRKHDRPSPFERIDDDSIRYWTVYVLTIHFLKWRKKMSRLPSCHFFIHVLIENACNVWCVHVDDSCSGIITATGSSIKWHFQSTWISHRKHGWSLNICDVRA